MPSFIQRFDNRVDEEFTRLRGHKTADRVFYFASAVGDFGLIWIFLAVLRIRRGRPNDHRAGMRAMIAIAIESVLVNAGIKSLFGRRRPVSDIEHPYPFRQPITSSFPSGHATAAFCAATLLSEDDKAAPLYFGAAAIVAASRVHTQIHHASDVIGGVVIGLALGQLARKLSPLQRPGTK